MNKLNILIYTIALAVIVGFITFYFTLQNVCADAFGENCTPTLPIPTDEYLPDVTPTVTIAPSPTLMQPTVIQPTSSPTPTAGQSATPTITPQIGTAASANNANLPLAAPDTGRGGE